MGVRDHSVLNRIRLVLEHVGLGMRVAPFPIRRLARPWTLDELPTRAGLEVAPPDFVGIGTQKSGTSWWASLIEAHPGVAENLFHRKEMHYFTHFFDRPMTEGEIAAYHAAFARPAGMLCGEWTPNYMASPHAVLRLDQAAPDAKALVMFRNPIDRYESGFNHEFRNRFGGMLVSGPRRRVIKRYALRKESIWMGMYAAQMDIVRRIIPSDRLLVLQYEQCRRNPAEAIARTYRFLGLDDSYRPSDMGRSVNRQKRVVAGLSEEAKSMLVEVYREDVRRLAEMFPGEIDVDLWPEFQSSPSCSATASTGSPSTTSAA